MKLLLLSFAAAGGSWWLQQQAELPPGSLTLVMLALPLLVWLAFLRNWHVGVVRSLVAATLFGAGFFWAAEYARLSVPSMFEPEWHGRDVEVEGVIAGLTQPGERGVRFVFEIERVMTAGARVPSRVSATWYDGWSRNPQPVPDLIAGQRWQLVLRLRPPHGNYNPHGFDLEAWMLERGIHAVGYVRDPGSAVLLSNMEWRPGYIVERARERIRGQLRALLDAKPYAGILIALAVGEQRAIPPSQWKVLTRNGVNHLVSISGLHITLVAGLVFAVVLRLWRRSGTLAQYVAPIRAATVAGFCFALAYAALAGFAIPTQRAICMLAVVAYSIYSGRRWPPSTILGVALLCVLMLDPMAVISAGFWLSYAAVAAILIVSTSSRKEVSFVTKWLRIQWAITIMLLPFLLVLFQQVSLVSPLANAIAIPVVSLCVAPLTLLLIVLPVDLIASVAHLALAACMAFLEFLADLPVAIWQQHAPVVWTIPLALAGVGLVLMPRGFPARWLGPVLMSPMFAVHPTGPRQGELWATVLDVGQGLAVVLRTEHHSVLFDAGPDYSGWSDAGDRIVVPYLRGEGVRRLDRMIVSHDDVDHSGGARSVAASVPAELVMSSITGLAERGLAQSVLRCESGQVWTYDDVRFEILHPAREIYSRSNVKDNDKSCVLRADTPYGSLLLPADIEARSEKSLVLSGVNVKADVLIVPHHGSRSSSSKAFVAAVGAKEAIVPAGHANPYGHPHEQVEALYRESRARLWRTDKNGAISLKFSDAGIILSGWRMMNPRYWHARTESEGP